MTAVPGNAGFKPASRAAPPAPRVRNAGRISLFLYKKRKREMNTYKNLSLFMLDIIEYEGRLDAQSHIGTMHGVRHWLDAERYFGGKIVESTALHPEKSELIFYVYEDEDGFYLENAKKFFEEEDQFIIEDVEGQRIMCWYISELQ